MNEFLATFNDRRGELLRTIFKHIQVSFIALFIVTLTAVPLDIALAKTERLPEAVMNIAMVLQAIPSLTLLRLTIPIFGIGKVPTIVALAVYAPLPILRNTYTGIKKVEPSLTEAVKGIDMKPMRRLTKVELPTTMPVVMAGVCTAMVLIIGITTLAILIGAGGLGDLILLSIDRNKTVLILTDVIPAASLAILSDLILHYMTKLPYKKLLITLGIILLIILLVTVVPPPGEKSATITTVGKLGSEPSIVTNMYKILIEEETHGTVNVKNGMGKASFLLNASKSDDIDGYLELTGTVLGELIREDLEFKEETDVYYRAKAGLEKKYDMTIPKSMKYNSIYALAVKRDFVKQYNLQSIGDLRKVQGQLKPGFIMEFKDRDDDYKAVAKKHNLNLSNTKQMRLRSRYTTIEKGDINLIDAYSTDAELKQCDMVTLKDDKRVSPPYQDAPMFKEKFLKEHPEVKKALDQLSNKITDEQMQEMNYKVTVRSEDPYKAAKQYLEREGSAH